MKNGVKNGENTQFSKFNQPSSAQKRQGWLRRKQAQKLMSNILLYSEMKLSDFNHIRKDCKKNPQNYTVIEAIAIQYTQKTLKSNKFLIHWLDLHISKAPKDKELNNKIYPTTFIFQHVHNALK